MSNITDEQKIYEVSKIWKEAAYNFAFWDKVDIDWDEEYKKTLSNVLKTKDTYDYYKELSRFVALLNDGHTGVRLPLDMLQDLEFFSMLPVVLHKFGKEIVIINTTEEYKEIIPLQSIVKKIDGIEADTYLKDECYPYIWHGNEAACGVSAMNKLMLGKRESEVTLTFEKDGKTSEVCLKREDPSKFSWIKNDFSAKTDGLQRELSRSMVHRVSMLGDIAIIKITSFQDGSVPAQIYECFDELKKAKGYIIDVRGNGGGDSRNADAIASLFIDGNYKSCFAEAQVYKPTIKAWSMFRDDFKNLSFDEAAEKFRDDKESLKAFRIWKNAYYEKDEGNNVENAAPGKLNGPIVVLMNEYTISAAEDFIDVMKMYTNAVFVGTNTSGSSGQPMFINLESGGMFFVCTRRCIAQNGEDIYNKGFAPDVTIAQTIEDFEAGRDAVLEKGLEIINSKECQED